MCGKTRYFWNAIYRSCIPWEKITQKLKNDSPSPDVCSMLRGSKSKW